MITNKKIITFLNKLQVFSIDVVIGTIAVGFFATKLLNVTPNPYWWLVLPLTVWVVYSLDHIIDSYKNKEGATIKRHKFHYIFRKPIIITIVIAGLASITLSVLFLEEQIIYYGLLLSFVIISYFIVISHLKKNKSAFLQKELIIAFVYTIGIFLAPLVWFGNVPSYPIILVIFNIFMLVWIEGILISWFEYDNDIKDGHTSFTVIAGKKNTRRFLIVTQVLLAILTKISILAVTTKTEFVALIITMLMNIILLVIILNPDTFSKNNYYRFIGELVFIVPILIIFS